jgi:hypothetical protein
MNGNINIWNIRTRITPERTRKNYRRTGMFRNLWFFHRNTRSTCPTSVFTGIGQTLMSRPVLISSLTWMIFWGFFTRKVWIYQMGYQKQIYFHWYKILGLLYKRALFDLQFVHNLFWLKLKWNARWKLLYCIIYRSSIWSSRTLMLKKDTKQRSTKH